MRGSNDRTLFYIISNRYIHAPLKDALANVGPPGPAGRQQRNQQQIDIPPIARHESRSQQRKFAAQKYRYLSIHTGNRLGAELRNLHHQFDLQPRDENAELYAAINAHPILQRMENTLVPLLDTYELTIQKVEGQFERIND